jgi:hypothetical protein
LARLISSFSLLVVFPVGFLAALESAKMRGKLAIKTMQRSGDGYEAAVHRCACVKTWEMVTRFKSVEASFKEQDHSDEIKGVLNYSVALKMRLHSHERMWQI